MNNEVDITKIETLLREIRSKIDSHNEFKSAYNKQLAFDFNIFNFFEINENKFSGILAYFLDPKRWHGQADAFLLKFLEYYKIAADELTEIKCEKVIDKKRKIDIFLRLKSGKIIAIENKIWAADQYNQLKDYAKYLEKVSKGNYLLIYLNPYGHSPSEFSISQKERELLDKSNKLKVSKYTHDIFELINMWIGVCEADNVTYFLKQFKKYLEVKFLGNNTLNINKIMEEIIKKNKTEVLSIIDAYYKLQKSTEEKFDEIAGVLLLKKFDTQNSNLIIKHQGPFYQPNGVSQRYAKYKAIKFQINKGDNLIYIHFKCDFINLYSSHYFGKGTEIHFEEFAKKYGFNKEHDVTEKSKVELVEIISQQIETAFKLFADYDKQ